MEVSDFHLIYIARPSNFSSSSLLFSMASFLVAFLVLCFEGSSTVTHSLIGSLSGVIGVIIVWCIWTSWEKHPISNAQPEKSLSFEGDDDDSEERPKKFTFEVIPESSITEEHHHWPSVLGLKFPLSFDWPSFMHRRRRQSYDCNGKVVEGP